MGTGPTNLSTQRLIVELKKLGRKDKVALWERLAEELGKPTRSRREVNLNRISNNAEKDEIALVPGKVLSAGEFTVKNTVAAFNFSEKAREKITKAGGKAISIQELIKANPKGKKVRIVG